MTYTTSFLMEPLVGARGSGPFPSSHNVVSIASIANNIRSTVRDGLDTMSAHEDDTIRGRALPDPALKLTIPSIHDNLTLDCRVYHPASLISPGKPTQWHKDAAIVAHPYAPMGGSYKDPIVDVIASTLLRLDYLVCTFNFRGAPGSAGRTSWTAKPERADYMSVIGFAAHYVHHLDPLWYPDTQDGPTNPDTHEQRLPVLLLAGYSYGAMITMQLPKLDTILFIFDAPEQGSAAAEIRLRAEHLAATQNTILAAGARAARVERLPPERSPRKSMGLRVGGDEDLRKSHELPRRSFSVGPEETYRTLVAKTRRRHKRTVSSDSVLQKIAVLPFDDHNAPDERARFEEPQSVLHMTPFRPAYLLVSPLRGIITHLASMSYSNMFGARTPKSGTGQESKLVINAAKERASFWVEAEEKLVGNPTLAVYGDQDVFVAAKRVREWATRLSSPPGSQFRAQEVATAGHFWREGRVIYTMRDAVRAFAKSLLSQDAPC